MKPSISYERWHTRTLKDPLEAAFYLNAAIAENDMELLLQALADVARAHGMSSIAKKADLHRVSLHKMLSSKGNPELRSFLRVIQASGLQLKVEPRPARRAA